jgi:hypothetical protein
MGSIRVSEKHGVNPSMDLCFFCGDTKGLVLAGRLPGDREAPRKAVWDKRPCDKCEGYMQQGVILIEVRDGSEDQENPFRTGVLTVAVDAFIRRLVQPAALADDILKRRMCFVPAAVWTALGLPRTQAESEAVGSQWVDKE